MKKVLAGAIVVLMASVGAVAWAQSSRTLDRVAGNDRFSTAVAISQRAFPDGAAEVYLARADSFADALAGSSLTDDGPILLVPKCAQVPKVVLDEVDRLNPVSVVALGGEGAVCQAVLDQFAGAAGVNPGPESVTLEADGDRTTDIFRLSGGDYTVTYNYSGDCFYGPSLESHDEDFAKQESLPSGSGPVSGEDNLFNVAPSDYFIDMISGSPPDCPWSVTLTRQ